MNNTLQVPHSLGIIYLNKFIISLCKFSGKYYS